MRIRTHLLILLFACSFGGMTLVAAVTGEQSKLNQRRDAVGENALMMRDVAQLEDGVGQFLLTTDLVIGSGESYLAPGAVRQADGLLSLLEGLGSRHLRAVCPDALASIESGLRSIRQDIDTSAMPRGDLAAREQALGSLVVSVDGAAETLLGALVSARSAAEAAAHLDRQRLAHRSDLLQWITWVGAGVYAALVAALWWWASRRISRPLVALAAAARSSMDSDGRFTHRARGPAEVQLLNGQLELLIGNLEENVDKRTEEIRRNNRRLADAVREAEQAQAAAELASRAKGEFLARMSHEIRTPLNGVLGVADLLQSRPLDALGRDYVGTIIHSADALLRLINDILDFSKVEAGKLELNPSDFAVGDLTEDMRRLLAGRAQEKGLSFSVEADESCPTVLRGDQFRLRQVLLNLLSNAIKFTRTGGVTLTLTAAALEPDGDRVDVTFEIRDTGIGMSPDQLVSVFDPFVQADGSTARCFGGTGLGLAISREIVELMGGQISAESKPGVGSVFRARIPFGRGASSSTAGRLEVAPLPPPIEGAGDLSVLVVEDNEINRMVATTALRHLGFEPDVACDGRAAVEMVRRGTTGLVLMDCQMPGMDGYEATRHIREWEAETGRAPVPIIALTANAFDVDRDRCAEVGMDDFLSKPFTVAMLREKIVAHVGAAPMVPVMP